MDGKNDRDINDVVNKLRASVDGVDGNTGKRASTARGSGGADMSRFDREIAALIEKQLGSRADKSRDKEKDDSAPSGSLIPDEIRLEDFVTDDAVDEAMPAAESAPTPEAAMPEPAPETTPEPVPEPTPAAEPEVPEAENTADEPADVSDEPGESDESDEPEIAPDEPDVEDSPIDDNDAAGISEDVDVAGTADPVEPVEPVEIDENDENDEIDDAADETSDAGSEEMPPAVADALAAAFAVDDCPDELPEGEVPWFEDMPAKAHAEEASEPEAADEPEPAEVPEPLEIPEEPEETELSEAPEEPELPEALEEPELSEEPETLELSEKSEEPELSEAPELLEIPEEPEEPQLVEISEEPELTEEPEPLAIHEESEEPELPETPEELELPEVPETLEIPDEPDEPELPEDPAEAEEVLQPEDACEPEHVPEPEPEPEPELEIEPETESELESEPSPESGITPTPDPSPASDDAQSDGWEYVGAEYSAHAQDGKIRSDYKRATALTALRLAFVSLICGVCAYMENLGVFGFKLLRPFEPTEDPAIFMLTLTALLLTAALICFREIRNGVVSLVKFDPEPHAITSVAFIIGLIYDIVMLILRPEGLVAYNFPVTLCMVMSVAAELFGRCRERATFDVVSAEAVRYSPVRESRAFEERYNSRPAAQEGERVRRRVYSAVASDFTDGYFRRTHSKKRGVYILNFMLLPALAVGVVECVIAASMGGGVVGSMSALMATVLMVLPAPLLICLTLPPLVSSAALKKKGCAIVGDSSVDEYAHPKLLVFEDSAMFPAERIGTKGIKLYDGFELYDVLIKTGSLFAFIGGPLGEVFKTESARYHRIHDVELVRVQRGGVEARLEGKTTILAGNLDFIAHYGVYPPTSPRDRQLISEGVVSVIFIVIDGRPAARLYADYRTNEQFEKQLTLLEGGRDAAAIRTSDPGIDEVMISRKRTLPDYELSVIRPGFAREGLPSETVDSGAVALDDPVKLIGVMNECHKLKNKRRHGLLLYFCAFLVSVIVATLTVTLRLTAYAVSGTVALYMLVWALPAVIMSFGGRRG